MKLFKSNAVRDYALTAIVAVAVALFIRSFVVEAYQIPSTSMKPTLLPGDVIFVAKWPYKLGGNPMPRRGDVIVFSDASNLDFIRRVIGLPGDRIQIKNGKVILNDRELITKIDPTAQDCREEKLPEGKSYEACGIQMSRFDNFGPETVPKNSLFVIADYRSESLAEHNKKVANADKRKNWAMIPADSVKGKAEWIWLSINTYREFGTPNHWLPRFRTDRMFRKIN